MVRKLIIVFAAVAISLGGFGLRGGALLNVAAAAGDPTAMYDCASMMGMSGGQDSVDCPEMNDEGHPDQPVKCVIKDCSLRSCAVSAFQISVALIAYAFPVSIPDLRPDVPTYASAAGKPPLRPPRSSILA